MLRIEDFLLRELESLSLIEIERLVNLLTENISYDPYDDPKFYKLERRRAELMLERMRKYNNKGKGKLRDTEIWIFEKTIEYVDILLPNWWYLDANEREEHYRWSPEYTPQQKQELIDLIESRKNDKKWHRKLPREA